MAKEALRYAHLPRKKCTKNGGFGTSAPFLSLKQARNLEKNGNVSCWRKTFLNCQLQWIVPHLLSRALWCRGHHCWSEFIGVVQQQNVIRRNGNDEKDGNEIHDCQPPGAGTLIDNLWPILKWWVANKIYRWTVFHLYNIKASPASDIPWLHSESSMSMWMLKGLQALHKV